MKQESKEVSNVLIKGALHGLCNRSTCLKPGAIYYNHSTREHYCKNCAELINLHNQKDAMEMFGHDLCTIVEEPVSVSQFDEQQNEVSEINVSVSDEEPKYCIDTFIKELQRISPDKRKLPLVIDCANGLEVYPSIKMRWDERFAMFEKAPDKMVITWNG